MQLVGSITALVTPFQATGEVDSDAFIALLQRQLAAGTQAVVVAGSTGEAASLSAQEYQRLVALAVTTVDGRIPVLAGTGQSSTVATIEQTRRAADAGANAALVVTPPYVRPTQAGLLAHYRAVASQGGLPVVLYNVPSRTGCDLLPETVEQLLDVHGIIGIKEAQVGYDRMRALLALRRAGFVVLSGDDPTAFEAMQLGADGLISVASNAAPSQIRELLDGARPDAPACHSGLLEPLQRLFEFLGVEPNPIPIKALLAALGLVEDVLRLPLLPLSHGWRGQLGAIAGELASAEQDSLRRRSA